MNRYVIALLILEFIALGGKNGPLLSSENIAAQVCGGIGWGNMWFKNILYSIG